MKSRCQQGCAPYAPPAPCRLFQLLVAASLHLRMASSPLSVPPISLPVSHKDACQWT